MKLYILLLSLLLSIQPLSAIHEDVEKAQPSVVFIVNEYNSFDASYPDPGFYNETLRPFYEWYWPTQYNHGTGFIISSDGYIVTNEHVVNGVTDFLVVMQTGDKRIRKATVVGKDRRSDIAVIKIENPEKEVFPSLSFGDSRKINAGDPVFAIGNPFYTVLESTVTSGVISAKDRNGFGGTQIEGYIQTDAALNGGNSGGPLLNSKGEVVGVNRGGYSSTGYIEGIGFAVPSHIAERIANQIICSEKVTQGYFGALLDCSKASAFDIYHFDPQDGAFISEIEQSSPADEAGLQTGDQIVAINDIPINSHLLFQNEILCCPEHATIDLTIDRDGETLEISVTLGDDILS